MGFATIGFDDLLIYTDIADEDAMPVVHLMESPAVVRDELQNARRGFQTIANNQEIVDNVERTVSRTETSDSEFAAFGDVEIAQQIGDEMRKVKNFALLIGVNEYIDPNTVNENVFTEALSHEKVSQSLVQTYLALKEQIQALETQLGEVSSVVFSETKSKIRLPKLIEEKAHEKALWL